MKSILMGVLASALLGSVALAQDKTVHIANLSDLSGLYADLGGPNSTLAAKMAVEDSGLTAKGWTITVVEGDHQNKPDVGVGVARKWIDEDNMDLILDVPNSGVALAISALVKEKNRVFIASGPATSELTNKSCTPNTLHWTYDTYALAHSTGAAVVKAGGTSWFFLVADYAFGHQLEHDTEAVVTQNGGKVLGQVNHPLNTSD
jgi:branched-chain amino acid transport system substrate-binding protein